jgi:7,8-dihydropterin-6-yl-methyl-4-(beta-D-ribofuranosyl)aminobenzene 5'-phosphate synthase
MRKKIAFTIVAFLILLIFGSLTYFYIDFSLGKKRVDQFYRDSRVEKIRDIGSTNTLEILPLIDWYTDRADLKGEAGVSYLIRTDELTILFDVGMNTKGEDPSPLIYNMKKLGVDYEKIGVIVISHNHVDHIGGFKWARKNSFSLTNHQITLKNKRVYTPEPMTYPGLSPVVADQPTIISKGVATTGTLPSYQFFSGWTPEQSLAINVTGKGIVLIVGCGHHTIPRLVERAGQLSDEPIVGIVGGLHYPITDNRLRIAGIPVQKILSTGKPPWSFLTMEDVNRNIAILKKLNPEIVALSPHDSCDASINAFRNAFSSSYREIKVGKKLIIGSRGDK